MNSFGIKDAESNKNVHNSPFEVCNVLICYNVYPEIKRIIKLAENKTKKKNINRLTNKKYVS